MVAEVIPSYPETKVVGGSSFGAAGGLVSQDFRVIDEGQTSFAGGETEAVEGGKEVSVFASLGGGKGREPLSEMSGGLRGDCRAVGRFEGPLETSLLLGRY